MKSKKIILILIIALIIIALIVVLAIASLNKKDTKQLDNVSSEPHIKTEDEKYQEEIEKLKGMGETARMQFYVSKYISCIEDGNYEKAYDLLYDKFKQNYFKTQSDFEKYIKNKYADIISLDYSDIKRLGTYYVLTVNFSDLINDEKNFTQLFVLKENNFNDFVLSFQAD